MVTSYLPFAWVIKYQY